MIVEITLLLNRKISFILILKKNQSIEISHFIGNIKVNSFVNILSPSLSLSLPFPCQSLFQWVIKQIHQLLFFPSVAKQKIVTETLFTCHLPLRSLSKAKNSHFYRNRLKSALFLFSSEKLFFLNPSSCLESIRSGRSSQVLKVCLGCVSPYKSSKNCKFCAYLVEIYLYPSV